METEQPQEFKESIESNEIREIVKKGYAHTVRSGASCCGAGIGANPTATKIAEVIGYEKDQLSVLPEGANLGLGCGNPTAIDALKPGETVLDLGCGAGMDVFLAARQVGPTGRVIGVDMTEEMLDKARKNAAKANFSNVEFRQGIIEQLPVESQSIDVIISNCVINLSPEKEKVFTEAHRVLKPGGRLQISDTVLLKPLPQNILDLAQAYIGCISGAMLKETYLSLIEKAGFTSIVFEKEQHLGPEVISSEDPIIKQVLGQVNLDDTMISDVLGSIASISFRAVK